MEKKSRSIKSVSFPKPNLNGFISNVEKQLKRFHHEEQRRVRTAYLYAIFLGMFGAHHFYLGRGMFGCMYLFTFGLFGIGYVVDLFRIRRLVTEANRRLEGEEIGKTMFETYLLWFPFGILGFHHFYLKDYVMGILYVFTLGAWGIGWVFDAVRIPHLVANYNGETYFLHDEFSLVHAYLFSLPPFGLLGAHHYYCRRKYWGLFYTFSLGGLGIGWMLDFVRMPFLVSRAEDKAGGKAQVEYHKDDVYLLWMSFGLFGAHHFYLKRYRWGFIYLVTFGILGVGWIADAFRIPKIIKEMNEQAEQEEELANVISMSERKIFTVPDEHDDDAPMPFDDVIHHNARNSPKVMPKITQGLGSANESFKGSPNSPRRARSFGQHPPKRRIESDSPVLPLRRTMTTESNSTNTVSVGESPHETRKHKVKQKQDKKGLIETEDTENKSEKTSKQNGDVVHQSKVGRRRSKQSNHTVQVDVHVHNVSDNDTGNGVVSSNKCDRKSSISLGHTIQSDDITEDNNNGGSGIASVDINRTPTIRVTKSNSVNVTSSEQQPTPDPAFLQYSRHSMRRTVSVQRKRRRAKRKESTNSATVGIDSPRDCSLNFPSIESPRDALFPGADPPNALQNEYR